MTVANINTAGIITSKELLFAAMNGLEVWMVLTHFNPEDRHKNFNGRTKLEKAKTGWYIGNIAIEIPTEAQEDDQVHWDFDNAYFTVYRLKNINYV